MRRHKTLGLRRRDGDERAREHARASRTARDRAQGASAISAPMSSTSASGRGSRRAGATGLMSIASPLGLLLAWELAAQTRIDRRALLPGAERDHRRADRDGAVRRADRERADQPAADRARLPARRRAGDRDRHRHGDLAAGPRARRSADRGDLSDPEKLAAAAHPPDLRARRDVEGGDGGDRRVLPDGDQRHRRRAADQPDLSRRRQELQGVAAGTRSAPSRCRARCRSS